MNVINLFNRRRICDHRGSGDGACPTCGASPQRKWLEHAARWLKVASDAVLRAKECSDRAGAESASAVLAAHHRVALHDGFKLRQTLTLLDGLDWCAVRDRVDQARTRRDGIRLVRERLERRRGSQAKERGTYGASCEAT